MYFMAPFPLQEVMPVQGTCMTARYIQQDVSPPAKNICNSDFLL